MSTNLTRTMVLLHEVAHLTGANQHTNDDAFAAAGFDFGILVRCLRPFLNQ